MDQLNKSIIEEIDSSFQFGWTPFLIHARDGDADTVQKLILEGSNVNSLNKYGLSALTVSVISNNEHTVKAILNAPNFNFDAAVKELIDPVSLASLLGFQNILLVLLERLPHLVNNIVPFSNYTPIFFAGIRRHHKIVEILIERGANLSLRNSAQQTILDIAIMMTDTELVALLSSKTGKESRKPPAHPSTYTPPRCLASNSIFYSPSTPKSQSKETSVTPKSKNKTPQSRYRKLYSESPILCSKNRRLGFGALSLHEENDTEELLSDCHDLSNSPLLPRTPLLSRTPVHSRTLQNPTTPSRIDTSYNRLSWSLNFDNFTPIAESSLAFQKSPGWNSCTFSSNNSNYSTTPKLLAYSHAKSPMVNRANSDQSPYVPSPSCWYHHFPSPHYPETPQKNNFLPANRSCPSPNILRNFNRDVFCTPAHHAPSCNPVGKSVLDSFATPMKFRVKKGFSHKKLLTKLYKRKSQNVRDENSFPEIQTLESVLNALGLQNYVGFFEMNEVEPEQLHTFTDSDLRSMGIDDKKVRQLILKRIQKKLIHLVPI